MTKKTVNEKRLNDDDDEIEERQPKAIRFFSQFNDADFDYVVTLYRKDIRGKRVVVREYNNEIPSINSIQELFGGGEYTMYANRYENGKSVEQIDTMSFNLADIVKHPSSPDSVFKQDDMFSNDNLQKLAIMKQLFGKEENGSSENMTNIMLKLAEMQNTSLLKMMEIQRQNETKTHEMITAFNDKMTNIIMEMKTNKPAIAEITEMFAVFNEISGNKSGETSPVDRLLEYAPLLMGNNQTVSQPIQQPANTYRVKQKTRAEEIDAVIKRIPTHLVEKLTEENKEGVITFFYEKNKDVCSRQDIVDVVNEILRRKQTGKM